MRQRFFATALSLFLAASGRAAIRPITPEDAPRADESVLAALNRGDEVVEVIVGVRDDTPSSKFLAAHPDPSGEPERRLLRLAAQKRLADDMTSRDFEARRYYESFSMIAGRGTRDGLIALANRSDVVWITVDGVRRKHQAPVQAAQALIRSDQANGLGITGAGETIAILDTGVDYGVADLGGGSFPNAKVIGGTDLADNDADPIDCEGHGTSVAAVAAGPTGVAPGAKIVALKIAQTSQCDTAQDSIILSGINWAITNQAAYHITAINLSFGGSPTDGRDHGYCDELYPQYATALESANGAGIVFVASAGNEALTNTVAVPACISTAVSVGAVYPESHSKVSWEDDAGGTLCTDQPVTPDAIVCFSNSASELSLLAPGAFWLVATKGGAIDYFHGTSASSPAVAGAVALVRQAHPELTPSAVASLLRSTGRPLTDSRNGILTPRIDTLAAVQQASGGFAPFDGIAVPIPDASGSATATATISGFTGTLASVQAAVEVEHDDPRQLIVTLTGPDGTSVHLHDRSGTPQRPINAVYGKTDASAESLALFQGKQANGIWTLVVEDVTPLLTGKIRNFAVRLLAGQPPGPIPASANTEVLPLVGHVQGTRLFLSDARIYNPLARPQDFSLFYVPQGSSGAQAVTATLSVEPGRVLALNDVIGSEFGYADSIGELTMLGPDTSLITTSRAYTRGANGTFGLFVPAFRSADALASGQTATANGLVKNAQFHTNSGFTEVAGAPVSVKMDIFSGDGALLASTTRAAAANATVLVTDIIGNRGLGATSNFRIDYTVGGEGAVIPFAAFVDDVTGDGVFEAAVHPGASVDDIVIAQASHATGANGDFFKTNLYVTNVGNAASVTISLIPRVLAGAPSPPRNYTIAAGQTLEKLDVLASEFGLADPSAAGLRIHPLAPARLAVSTRTFVEKFGGTFGFSIPGLAASEAIGAGGGTATVIQLDQTSAAQGYRSNFGFAEVAGADASVRVTASSGDTGGALGSRVYALPAGSSFQANVGDILGSGAASNIYLRFTVESGAGRVLAYGVSIDNASGDAIYIPAAREP